MSFVSGQGRRARRARLPVKRVAPLDGGPARFRSARRTSAAPDLRARGRLQYVGGHYLRFAGTRRVLPEGGADSPETLLAYADFDGTIARKPQVPLQTYAPHVGRLAAGDPTWKDGKGKGLIGALNYLAAKASTRFRSCPTTPAATATTSGRSSPRRQVPLRRARSSTSGRSSSTTRRRKGLLSALQAAGNRERRQRRGNPRSGAPTARAASRAGVQRTRPVTESLDGGDARRRAQALPARTDRALRPRAGPELESRRREHAVDREEQRAMAQLHHDTDPYDHHIVVHTLPERAGRGLSAAPRRRSPLTGASLQNRLECRPRADAQVGAQRRDRAGKPWVVANDEQGRANLGVPPDPGYAGFRRPRMRKARDDRLHLARHPQDARCGAHLMAGGAGVEYYFGYQLPENDLVARRLPQPRQDAGTTAASRSTSSASTRSRSGR